MKNYIIIGVIVIIIVIAVVSTVKHFKGEGGCCGGGSYKPKRKKLLNIKYQKTFKVYGMHCVNCKRKIEELVNDIHGVAGKIDLKKEILTVFYDIDVEDQVIISKIERVGYTVELLK